MLIYSYMCDAHRMLYLYELFSYVVLNNAIGSYGILCSHVESSGIQWNTMISCGAMCICACV